MKTTRQMTIKPSLLNDIIALPQKEARQINAKIQLLTQDPMPDGKTKKHLKHIPGKLHRLRCGDYRVIYTYNEHSLGIVAIRRRNESTYDDDDLDIDLSEDLDVLPEPPMDTHHATPVPATPAWDFSIPVDMSKRLPEPITMELLDLTSRQPATQLPDHLSSPISELFVMATMLLVVAFGGSQHREKGQRPHAARPRNGRQ